MSKWPTVIAISGWRNWTDADYLEWVLLGIWNRYLPDIHWRVGDAKGVDELCAGVVRERLYAEPSVYVADWDRHGRAAGPLRSAAMLAGRHDTDPTAGRRADRLIAFPEPLRNPPVPNSGTWRAIYIAHSLGIEVTIPAHLGRRSER